MVAQFNSNLNVNSTPNPETPTPHAIGVNDLANKKPLNPQPKREETIEWVLAMGLPPLPVAPAFNAYEYPQIEKANAKTGAWEHCPLTLDLKPMALFTGKNPSYLDAEDKPHTINHGNYQKRMPSERELKMWFANPLTGIGTLGSPNDIWLDFDLKHFTDEVECSVKAWAIAGKIKEISGHDPTIERTHSGGWRVQVFVEETPNFTNFALAPGGKHVGEALGAGKFTVLAPTLGVSGKRYTTYHRHDPETKPVVPNLEAIGVYSSKKSKAKTPLVPTSTQSQSPRPVSVPGSIPLSDLACPTVQEILKGVNLKGDRSASLATLLHELYGWERWCQENGKTFSEDAESLAYEAGQALGIDASRIGRIIKTIDVAACTPALEYRGKDCQKHYNKIAKANGVKASGSNGKVVPLSTAYPKVIGGNDNFPPVPPNYGGGRGGNDPNDADDWRPPEARNGQLGYWVYPKNKDPYFDIKTNFDFVILKEFERYVPEGGEPTDPDGGGLQLKLTRASDGKVKTLLITSQDYGTAKSFTSALKKRLGLGIKCRISDYDLQALLHTKLWEYHRKGGKVYTLASVIGQQPDGTWVFPKVKFTPSGQTITDDDNLWIFNTNVSTTDKLPYPNIPPEQDVSVLTELILAIKDVAGTNKNRWLLALGWVVMWLNQWHIPHSNLPILASYGNPGTLKTQKMLAALSVIWGDEEEKNTLRKTSESYLYEILSRLTLPFLWDDAKATNKDEMKVIDNVIIDVYGRLPRRVRGQDQTPQTSMLITSNPQLGDALDAAQSRLFHIFLPQTGVKPTTQALRQLKNVKKEAPKAFSALIGIGYDQEAVDELTDTLRDRLPTAHDRAPHHLALVVYYTQKVLELAGVNEDFLTWVLDEFCLDVNADQSNIDALTDFFDRLRAAQVNSYVGDWCGRITSGNDGREYLALYMPSVWPAITRKEIGGEPSSYNQRMVERLLKEKGAKGGTVRLAATKLQVDTQTIAKAQGKDESELGTVPEVPRYCLKIPRSVWEAYKKSDDPVMCPPPNHITSTDVDRVTVSASTPTVRKEFCNVDSEKHITKANVDGVSVLASTPTPCNVCNECNVGNDGSGEKKVGVEADVNDISSTSDEANIHSETNYANPATLPPENTLHTLQAPNANAEKSATHRVQDVMSSVMSLSCNDLTSDYVEVTPGLPPALELAPKLDHCDTWAQIQDLCAEASVELFEEALTLLEDNGDRIRRLQADASVTSKPEIVTPAVDAQDNKDAPTTSVGKQYRYDGGLSHQLKDAEGNLLKDAEGKPLVLKRGSELVLEEVECSVNPDYATVRPIGVDCQKLGIRRAQLKETSNG